MNRNIQQRIKNNYAINHRNWPLYVQLFQLIDRLAKLSRAPFIGPVLKKMLRMDRPEKHYTQGLVVNIDQKINAPGNAVLPVDILRETIETASFHAIMHRCICRDGGNCKHYPIDFGCIFIGEGARVTVQRGIARPAAVSEALAHIGQAADLGLVCQAIWVEAEEYLWGIPSSRMHEFLEICFCCPCCCIALKNYRNVDPDIRARFRSIGWRASVTSSCNNCGVCRGHCPVNAIRIQEDNITISDGCIGCGICASVCSKSAISLIQVAQPRKRLESYFNGFYPKL